MIQFGLDCLQMTHGHLKDEQRKAILKVFERNHCFLSLTTEYGNLLYLLLGGCHEFKLNPITCDKLFPVIYWAVYSNSWETISDINYCPFYVIYC